MSLTVGQLFSSFADLEAFLENYKKTNFIDLYVRNSRSVENGQKRLSKSLKPELVYYEIKFACVHGGRKFSSRGTGQRLSR